MQKGQQGGHLGRDAVVIGNYYLHPQGLGPMEGLPGADAVIHGYQQAATICGQPFHHGGIKAVAILLAAWDSSDRFGAQPLQHPN